VTENDVLGPGEYAGLRTEGDISSKNGKAFSLPRLIFDCRDVVAVDDLIGYENSPRLYRITFVDPCLVKMVLHDGK
jgi:hypothetical protein